MSEIMINLSGADGSGSGKHIYEAPLLDDDAYLRTESVTHGAYTAGPGSPDNERIEVVDMRVCGIQFRVRADEVRAELRGLYAAIKACSSGDGAGPWTARRPASEEMLGAWRLAFAALRSAVIRVCAGHITLDHLERMARESFDRGARAGKASLRDDLRGLLGI